MLKDYYFDTKYPGENFVNVTKQECTQCLVTMYDVIDFVNKVRKHLGLDYIAIERKLLHPGNSIKKLNAF